MAFAENTVRDLLRAIEHDQWRWVDQLLAEDLTVRGWTPDLLNKEQFVRIFGGLRHACPDLRFDFRDLLVLPNGGVWLTTSLRGTHRAPLTIGEHIATLPTNKSFQLPDEHPLFHVVDGVVTAISVDPVPSGGLSGVFAQLGLSSPFLPMLPLVQPGGSEPERRG